MGNGSIQEDRRHKSKREIGGESGRNKNNREREVSNTGMDEEKNWGRGD